VANCSIAAADADRRRSEAARVLLLQVTREFRRGGGLAGAFSPTIRIRAGFVEVERSRVAASKAVSSSWKILTTCWPGVTLRKHFFAERFSLIRATKFFATW